jgi:hypothetical protein
VQSVETYGQGEAFGTQALMDPVNGVALTLIIRELGKEPHCAGYAEGVFKNAAE